MKDNTSLTWLPVRCCCQPKKVLGFMRLDKEQLDRDHITLLLERASLVLELHGGGDTVRETDSYVNVQLREFYDHGINERAIYSDDKPLSFWKQFSNFLEVAH